ncbi:MAG: hypothetical protein SCH66_04480 [Methanolobus sp.]|nr:hypothetical protein [Methanolobus sp.]
MKKIGMKIFAYIAIVLMLASVIPAVALADSDNGQKKGIFEDEDQSTDEEDEQSDDADEEDDDIPGVQIHDRDRDRTRTNASENAPRNAMINQVKNVKNAQARYGQARDSFLQVKANNPALNSEEAIEAAKEYLNSTIDVMIESLDDEEYIEQLNAEKEDIAAATTRAELAESARDIRDIWKDARKERTASAAKTINNKLTAVIRVSENMATRLENEIARMEQNGEDVTGLEEMLEEYNILIAEATEYQDRARNAYTNGNSNDEAVRYMNQAGQSIRDANAVLKDMLQALKQHRDGLVVLNGNGTLAAEGDGTAVISGNFTLNFAADGAMLVIKDMAGDAEINTEDATFDSSNVDSGNSDYNNRAYVYHNLTGDVTIEGSRLTVMLRGSGISLDVDGTGTAMLSGDGTYEVNGVESSWAIPDADDEEEMESEEETEEETEEESEDDSEEDESSDDDSSEEGEDSSSDDNSTEESGNETSGFGNQSSA